MYRHFLVPLDHSDAGIDAVAYAVELARSIGARITFVHLDREPCEGARPVDGPLEACMREMAIAKAGAAARAQGVPCDSMRAAADAAYTLARDAGAMGWDLICVAPPAYEAQTATAAHGRLSAAFMAPFAAAGVPVLTCAVPRIEPAARAVAALYRAHRVATGPLCALLAAAREAVTDGAAHAVRRSPQQLDALRVLHLGPGDACWLSSVLSGRTPSVDAELGELERQYRHGMALYAELVRAAAGEVGDGASQRLESALDAYARFVWEYLGRKEGVIVPAAQRYLSDDDWREIDTAFEAISAGQAAGPRQLNVSWSTHR